MLTNEKKAAIYSCVKRQFPDTGLYRISRVSEWLFTNGYSLEALGYESFRAFAVDFPEMFTFQDDDNDIFIKINNWEDGNRMIQQINTNLHPADSFFGTSNIILNDDIIEMSQQSLYALTKILGSGYTVQEMKQNIYNAFSQAKENHTLTILAEKYVFPIDYCVDGFLVNGIITKNISPRGKSLYFSFEKTQIFRSDNTPIARKRPESAISIGEEDKQLIYNLLMDNFPTETPLHMAAISKLLTDNNIDRTKYGCYKMKEFLSKLDFLSMNDVVLGGVPQIMVTIHSRNTAHSASANSGANSANSFAAQHERGTFAKAADTSGVIPEGSLDSICNMPPKPVAIIQKHLEAGGRYAEHYTITHELTEDFDKARSAGTIRFYEGKMIFPCRYTKADGSPVEITLKPSAYEGKPWFLYYIDTAVRDKDSGTISPGKQLENFAFLGSWSSFLTELAEKAVDEEWDFQNSTKKSYQILIQYIKYTFCRLVRENKVCISGDGKFAAFNTGLVDKRFDDIYACFEPNDSASETKWKFTGFCTAASGGLGKLLVNYFNPLPQPPCYFRRSEDLLFDLNKHLHTDFEHIIIDNIRRLPLQFLYDQFFDNNEAKELVERIRCTSDRFAVKALYEELKSVIENNSRLFVRIQNRIKDSIELARKRVRWNYKTAIPSYFPKRDSMSLMLPLCLTDEDKPDVALVVELTQSGNYQGQTILTIPQAYIDARLMCRLTSDWLSPQQIVTGTECYDEQDFTEADDVLADID